MSSATSSSGPFLGRFAFSTDRGVRHIAARAKSPSAFGERGIPPRGVAQRSKTPGILAFRAWAIRAPRPPRCDDGLSPRADSEASPQTDQKTRESMRGESSLGGRFAAALRQILKPGTCLIRTDSGFRRCLVPWKRMRRIIPGRGIPPRCVATPSNMSNILGRRALRSGRRAPGPKQRITLPGD
jgi:hypothetical protein